MVRSFSFLCLSFFSGILTLQAVVINHSSVDGVASYPQTTMDAIGDQTWLFTHASVGWNMLSGMDALHSSNPTRYQLSTTSIATNGNQAADAPASLTDGTIYGCDRGNPGWSSKITIFDNSVRNAGWNKADIVMDKFCYIDQNAVATTYLNTISALETAYPNTVVVYTTMPLTTGEDSDNVLRNQYNTAVRNYCVANNKLLFDIADIEAYTPTGTQMTFISDGQTYQKLYSSYSTDGGHLNATGSERLALGWYATAANAPEPGCLILMGSFVLALWSRRHHKI
jgi:hypothetical protein